uniref:Uncharacterized protein n=1 Tax=Anopheles maculatus TaxID=74869 RepID=A0A182SG27_9DIPT
MGQEQDLGEVDMEQRKDIDQLQEDNQQQQQQQQGDESSAGLKNGTAKLTVQSAGDLKQTILDGLEKKGDGGLWLCTKHLTALWETLSNPRSITRWEMGKWEDA